MEESDKIKEDFEEIKKRIRELEKEVNKRIKTVYEIKEEKNYSKKEGEGGNKKYVKILVTLIIILLIIDIISLVAYYKPDFSSMIKSNNSVKINESSSNNINVKKCSDGTLIGGCSQQKPLFCYNGELLKNAAVCGCPSGYKIDFQSCVKI